MSQPTRPSRQGADTYRRALSSAALCNTRTFAPDHHHLLIPAAAWSRTSSSAAEQSELVDWVRQAGGSVGGVAVRPEPGGLGYGLLAADDCAAGTELVRLPQACQLSYGAATDPRLLALIDRVPSELWGAKLALQVCPPAS